MAQTVVTRSQRRIERKLATWIVILVLVVAGVSFALGYGVGRKSANSSGMAMGVEPPRLPIASQPVPPPPEKPEAKAESTQPEKLTFYDNLPKGDQAPLGSGINLPPKSSAKTSSKAVEKPAEAKPVVEKPVAAKPETKSPAQPSASATGGASAASPC